MLPHDSPGHRGWAARRLRLRRSCSCVAAGGWPWSCSSAGRQADLKAEKPGARPPPIRPGNKTLERTDKRILWFICQTLLSSYISKIKL